MAYADIVATAQERQEYQDMLRILELLRKNHESELIGQEAAEYLALEARLEASGAFKRLLTLDASGQIVIRPEFLERISGGQAAPTEPPSEAPPTQAGQPLPADDPALRLRQRIMDLTRQLAEATELKERADIQEELNTLKGLLPYFKERVEPTTPTPKGPSKFVKYFDMEGEDEEGNLVSWQLGLREDGTTEVIPGTIRGVQPKPTTTTTPTPKEPYSTALTSYQEKFMDWYRKTQEEKYGEKSFADKIRLGLVVPETRGGKRGYYDIESGKFIETGEAEPGPMKYLKSITRRTGKRSQYGDYEVEDVDLMQDPTTGQITESVRGSPHWEEGEAGRVEAGYAPAAWAGQQAYGQKVAAALAPQNTSAYLGGSIQEALKLWPILGLPQQATVMDMLKQQGVSFPGQPKYISSPGATGTAATIKAPEFPLETIQNKPPPWLQATTRWR